MSTATLPAETFEAIADHDRWYVTVPWRKADELHSHLEKQGYASTICLEPSAQEARLELRAGVDPQQVVKALTALHDGETSAL